MQEIRLVFNNSLVENEDKITDNDSNIKNSTITTANYDDMYINSNTQYHIEIWKIGEKPFRTKKVLLDLI